MFNGNSPSLADIAAVTGNNKDGWAMETAGGS